MSNITPEQLRSFVQSIAAEAYPGQSIPDEVIQTVCWSIEKYLDWGHWDGMVNEIVELLRRAIAEQGCFDLIHSADIAIDDTLHRRRGEALAVIAYILSQPNASDLATTFHYWYTRYVNYYLGGILPRMPVDDSDFSLRTMSEWQSLKRKYTAAIGLKDAIETEVMHCIYRYMTNGDFGDEDG